MPKRRIVLDLFAEDEAHERFIGAIVRRVAEEEGTACVIRPRIARGGHPAVMRELKLYQRISQGDPPDILLITRDANASSWTTVRAQVVKEINPRRASSAIVACPDPYIERWYLADPRSLEKALGAKIPSLKGRKTRDRYKTFSRNL